MRSAPILGLNIRVVVSLAVILGLFILVTQVSISELTRVTVFKHLSAAGDTPGIEAVTADMERAFINLRELVLFYLITGAAVALVLGALVIRRQVSSPLIRINRALARVADGRLDTSIPIEGARELADLGVAFNRMTATLSLQKQSLEEKILEVETSARELEAAQDRLIRAAKLASVGTLAAGVAHEIGNPLAGVLGLLDALDAGEAEAPETREKYLALMRKEIERIDRIIRDLLAFARPPRPSEEAPPASSLPEVAAHLRALLRAQPLFDRVEIVERFPGDVPALAIPEGDLTQLLLNLFLNAAQAMAGEGRIELDVLPRESARPHAGTAPGRAMTIRVSDTGPGVAASAVDKIFDPFFSGRKAGAGLGLAICQSICDRAGGDISLDPTAERGTRFVITLPVLAPNHGSFKEQVTP
jgi:two-component system, NtrC family, sensor kinase